MNRDDLNPQTPLETHSIEPAPILTMLGKTYFPILVGVKQSSLTLNLFVQLAALSYPPLVYP